VSNIQRVAIDYLLAQLPALREEARELRAQEARAGCRAGQVDRLIEAIEALRAPVPAKARRKNRQWAGKPRGQSREAAAVPTGIAAVRQVMREEPGRIWGPGELHEVLVERGWISPSATKPRTGTDNRLQRLVGQGEIEKIGRGQYRYRRSASSEATPM
jgi:hypothetical protein